MRLLDFLRFFFFYISEIWVKEVWAIDATALNFSMELDSTIPCTCAWVLQRLDF